MRRVRVIEMSVKAIPLRLVLRIMSCKVAGKSSGYRTSISVRG